MYQLRRKTERADGTAYGIQKSHEKIVSVRGACGRAVVSGHFEQCEVSVTPVSFLPRMCNGFVTGGGIGGAHCWSIL